MDNDRSSVQRAAVTNFDGLARDLRFLAGMPELCDVQFIVGEERTPLYGVRAILAIRSRVFYKLLFGPSALRRGKGGHGAGGSSPMGRRIQKMFSFSSLSRSPSSQQSPPSPQTYSGSSDTNKTVVTIDEFDADVFKQVLDYVHTGVTTLHPGTVVGLMNAADHFSLKELRRACLEFANGCIQCESVCSLLTAAEKYIQYKSTKVLMQKVLEFIDRHAEQVLALSDFVHLPEHVVQLIISRDEMKASELSKFRAVERWSLNAALRTGCHLLHLRRFAPHIALHEIPASVLMTEIRPLQIVADAELMAALAFQADPSLVCTKDAFARTPKSQRRLTVCFSPIDYRDRSLSSTAVVDEDESATGSDRGSSGYESLTSHTSRITAKNGATLVHIPSFSVANDGKAKSYSDLTFFTTDRRL